MTEEQENKNEKINDWLNEHGQPNFAYLQSLVTENSIESLNKLRYIAQDLNVDYNSSNTNEQLMDMISSAIRSGGDA